MIFIVVDRNINDVKFASDDTNMSYKIGYSDETHEDGEPDIMWNSMAFLIREHKIWFRGEFEKFDTNDLSNLITIEDDFAPVSTSAFNAIQKGTLKKINGKSIEEEDINLDLSLYVIVKELPTENIKDNKIYLTLNGSSEEHNVFDEYVYDSESKNMGIIRTTHRRD